MNNINDLNNKLRKAQKDIEDYQESCKHGDQIIRMNEKTAVAEIIKSAPLPFVFRIGIIS